MFLKSRSQGKSNKIEQTIFSHFTCLPVNSIHIHLHCSYNDWGRPAFATVVSPDELSDATPHCCNSERHLSTITPEGGSSNPLKTPIYFGIFTTPEPDRIWSPKQHRQIEPIGVIGALDRYMGPQTAQETYVIRLDSVRYRYRKGAVGAFSSVSR